MKQIRILKDLKKRKGFNFTECTQQFYKYIYNNLYLDIDYRQIANKMIKKISRNKNKNRIKNRCVITGRGRSVHKLFRLSRIQIREQISLGTLTGINKSSW